MDLTKVNSELVQKLRMKDPASKWSHVKTDEPRARTEQDLPQQAADHRLQDRPGNQTSMESPLFAKWGASLQGSHQ